MDVYMAQIQFLNGAMEATLVNMGGLNDTRLEDHIIEASFPAHLPGVWFFAHQLYTSNVYLKSSISQGQFFSDDSGWLGVNEESSFSHITIVHLRGGLGLGPFLKFGSQDLQ